MNIPAGFGRLSQVAVMEPGNFVLTSGLANCIAIAGYHEGNRRMVLGHFDTLHCWDAEARNFRTGTLLRWRDWVRGQANINSFQVGLGAVWFNTAPESDDEPYSTRDNWRYDLICKVTQIFNYEPIIACRCIRFGILAGGRPGMEGSAADDWMGTLNWAHAGQPIPYDTLRG